MIGQPVSSFPQLIMCVNRIHTGGILTWCTMLRVFSFLANGGYYVFSLDIFRWIHLLSCMLQMSAPVLIRFLNDDSLLPAN